MRLGVLAYGSLIDDPGPELAALVVGRRDGVETPFRIEWARRAATRGGAPTLAPVPVGGARVRGTLLELDPALPLAAARDVVFRRELHIVGSGRRYDPARTVLRLAEHPGFADLDLVLSVALPVTLAAPRPQELAAWAVASACGATGAARKDGISYLAAVRAAGVETPRTAAFAEAVLARTGAADLADAWRRARAAGAR